MAGFDKVPTRSTVLVEDIKEKGIKEFLETQKKKYECPKCGDILSVHNGKCYTYGHERG
jgi:predicted RNA-binding Zn-ribbon protein involved in translation (DUF1610 family)